MRFFARAAAAVGTAVVLAVAAAGPAAAHFCYKTGNPNNGTNGQAWMTQEEWLGFIDAIEVLDTAPAAITACEAGLAAVRAHVAGLRRLGPDHGTGAAGRRHARDRPHTEEHRLHADLAGPRGLRARVPRGVARGPAREQRRPGLPPSWRGPRSRRCYWRVT